MNCDQVRFRGKASFLHHSFGKPKKAVLDGLRVSYVDFNQFLYIILRDWSDQVWISIANSELCFKFVFRNENKPQISNHLWSYLEKFRISCYFRILPRVKFDFQSGQQIQFSREKNRRHLNNNSATLFSKANGKKFCVVGLFRYKFNNSNQNYFVITM